MASALINNNTCCEISCFLKTTAKKLVTNTLLVPQPKSWGTSAVPTVVAPMVKTSYHTKQQPTVY